MEGRPAHAHFHPPFHANTTHSHNYIRTRHSPSRPPSPPFTVPPTIIPHSLSHANTQYRPPSHPLAHPPIFLPTHNFSACRPTYSFTNSPTPALYRPLTQRSTTSPFRTTVHVAVISRSRYYVERLRDCIWSARDSYRECSRKLSGAL